MNKHWYNNDIVEVFQLECPEGFKPGRLSTNRHKFGKNNIGRTHVSSIKGKTLPKEWKDNISSALFKLYENGTIKSSNIGKHYTKEEKEELSKKNKEAFNIKMNTEQGIEAEKQRVNKIKEYWTEDKKQQKSLEMKEYINNLSEEDKKDWYSHCKVNSSKAEIEIYNYITSFYKKEVIQNDRHLGFELDIYIPDQKLAFEYNGTYFHSTLKNCPEDYHRNKQLICLDNGIRLVHLYEFEFKKNKDLLLHFVKSCFNVRKKGYVEYEIKEINRETAKEFVSKYHLYGYVNSSTNLGLYTKDGLVAVSTFIKNKKGYEWKRYVQLPIIIQNHSIPVLFFEYFKDNYMKVGEKLIDYQQLDRWPDVNNYSSKTMGFKNKGISKSNIWIKKDGVTVSHRSFCPEKKTSLYGKKYHPDEDWTSEQVAHSLGYVYHLHGSGTNTWEYTKS